MINAKYKEQLVQQICRFVRIPSRSFPEGGEEGALQRLIADEMHKIGARVRAFEPDEIAGFRQHPLCCGPGRNYKGRPTVVGELGPVGAPALLVMAHSDTVPVYQPDAWTFDPFCGELRDGRVCGLGARDDKCGLAIIITVMRALRDCGQPLKRRLIFASTIDEENGVGNGLLLLMLAGIRAEAAFYLDGRQMDVCIGNCGGSNLYLRPKADVVPSDLLRDAGRLEQACLKLSRERAPLFERPYYACSDVRMMSVKFNRRDDRQGPFFLLAFFTLPGEVRDQVCRQLEDGVRASLGAAFKRYTLSYREPWFEPALLPADTPLVRLLADSLQSVLKRPARITTVPKQDAFIMNNHARIPTISFGVSLQQGAGANHFPNEAVPVADAWAECQVVFETIRRWLAEKS